MGILRVYLALCVIAAHATANSLPSSLHSGKQAVQIFYLISGFYMALVLSSRYSAVKDFYLSRFLRIFPTYWIVAAATIAWCALMGWVSGHWLLLAAYRQAPLGHNGALGVALAAGSNLTVFGQDWIYFLRQNAGESLRLTRDFWGDPYPLWHYSICPQAWSIGVELTFYSLVPWLSRCRTRWLLALAATGLAARLIAYTKFGLAHDPWDYRFFPFELSVFLTGMIGYRVYARVKDATVLARFRLKSTGAYLVAVVALVVGFYLDARLTHHACLVLGEDWGLLAMLPFWAVAVPAFFLVFGQMKADRLIGELSYPIYLIHLVVLETLRLWPAFVNHPRRLGWTCALISVGLAALLYRFYIAPAERRRHRIAHARGPARSTEVAPAQTTDLASA